MLRLLVSVLLLAVLVSCSSTPGGSGGGRYAGGGPGMYKVGNTYSVNGQTYTPREDYEYDETGIASWYGDEFGGRRTANGEVFDPNELTAAHRTLPMPSLVRVTNLENGKSVVVRVNDRGPFASGRIIDLSRRAAQLLGFDNSGTAKVRVSVLEPESRALAEAGRKRLGQPVEQPAEVAMAAANPQAPVDESSTDYAGTSDGRPPVITPIETVAPDEYPQSAPVGAVEEVPLEAPPVGQISASKVAAAKLPPLPKPEPILKSVPGKRVNGRFYPAPKVQQLRPEPNKKIYVQAGAFAKQENANALKSKLSAYAPSTVSKAQVGGKTFYRVRVGPLKSVDEADKVMSKVLPQNGKARITVE